jgi:hypothetical protein
VLESVFKPAVPELVERGTAAAPKVLERAMEKPTPVAVHGKNLPYVGDPELKEMVRATPAVEKPDPVSIVQRAKEVMGSFFRAEPNLPKDLQETFKNGRYRSDAARSHSDQFLRHVYEPLTKKPDEQARLMYDYLIHADEIAQAERSGRDLINGKPLSQWQSSFALIEKAVQADPEIVEAMRRHRELWDGIFADMLARGWTVPEHYLEEYTPIRKLTGTLKGLASWGGEKFQSKLLNSQMHRTGMGGLRQTDLLSLEHDVIEDYLRKVSEHETFIGLLNDPTIHFTDKFKPWDVLPPDLDTYRPGPGMLGYNRKAPEGHVLDGMLEEAGLPKNTLSPGGYVFPKPVVRALERYHRGFKSHPLENELYTQGRKLWPWLTTYNPANTFLNVFGDTGYALLGLPGEKAQPLGVLSLIPKATGIASRGAFGKGGTIVEVGGQKVDLWDLAERELGESTLFNQVQDKRVSDNLARLVPQDEREHKIAFLDLLERSRHAAEMTPRIAAGLEAWQRTGNIKEFGRVGRKSTLEYGGGAPLFSRLPLIRVLSPFIQFAGLNSARVADMVSASGSRTRTVGALMAMPIMTWMWNTHSDAYRKVEDALSPAQRDQPHVIVPGPDPEHPRTDIEGKPVVWAIRISAPEEVMHMAGLGNLASRVERVVRGRETPGQFVGDVAKRAGKAMGENLTMVPGLLSDVTAETDISGRPYRLPERIARLLPIARPVIEGAKALKDYGPAEAGKRVVEETTGQRFLGVMRRGETPSDADRTIAYVHVRDAKKRLRKQLMNGSPTQVKEAREDWDKAVEELQRLSAAIAKEKANEQRP